jgi:hypothetical protein
MTDTALNERCQAFMASRQSVVLSTCAEDGRMETSAVPFVVLENGRWAILVSELATHTRNLLWLVQTAAHSGQPAGEISGLLLADEVDTPQPFARQRMALRLGVMPVARTSPSFQHNLSRLRERFGEVVSVLEGLADFHCFELEVLGGRYVEGFGAAYEFSDCPCHRLQRVRHT